MAEEEKTEDVAPEEGGKKAGKFPIVIIVVLILVGLLLAGGISYFVTTQFVGGGGNQTVAESRNHDPGTFVKLGDAKEGIIVNVGGIKSTRFLKVGITVELNPEREDNVLEGKLTTEAETKIMDTTLQIIRTLKVEELDAARQDDFKDKLKSELNKALGEGSVYDIYITSFLLQ